MKPKKPLSDKDKIALVTKFDNAACYHYDVINYSQGRRRSEAGAYKSYLSALKKLLIVVLGREPTPEEMDSV